MEETKIFDNLDLDEAQKYLRDLQRKSLKQQIRDLEKRIRNNESRTQKLDHQVANLEKALDQKK